MTSTNQQGSMLPHSSGEMQQSTSGSSVRSYENRTIWERATSHNRYMCSENGYRPYVYVRLWCLWDLTIATVVMGAYLIKRFLIENTAQFELCNSCCNDSETNSFLQLNTINCKAYLTKLIDLLKTYPLTAAYLAPNNLHADTPSAPRGLLRNP